MLSIGYLSNWMSILEENVFLKWVKEFYEDEEIFYGEYFILKDYQCGKKFEKMFEICFCIVLILNIYLIMICFYINLFVKYLY